MTAPADDTTTDLHAVIATLRAERDAAQSEKAASSMTVSWSTLAAAARRSWLPVLSRDTRKFPMRPKPGSIM